jgi:sugar/nucleoside kinase (ribokinase family)
MICFSCRICSVFPVAGSFAAGFLYALAQERSLKACLQAGAVLSGEVIQVIGTTLPESTWHNIRAAVQ